MKKCSIRKCNNELHTKGYCVKHYMRWRRHGNPLTIIIKRETVCSVRGCKDIARSLDYCPKHYARFHKWGNPLTLGILGCDIMLNTVSFSM